MGKRVDISIISNKIDASMKSITGGPSSPWTLKAEKDEEDDFIDLTLALDGVGRITYTVRACRVGPSILSDPRPLAWNILVAASESVSKDFDRKAISEERLIKRSRIIRKMIRKLSGKKGDIDDDEKKENIA